ncbi:putative membrane protein [Actinoplanes octamycinicus]|uniref:Putative membrane protein n=1 Tax=Actinoplanes octamycinicus TaxID=135948 RepID=A0A7W7GY99_9ACTN|nr:DUF6325 family protein [Actinoplanes octamycinicus]MBB4740347.1 putative membrane protein [Actinoplanes octamycinicus]GIE62578.1 DUF1269 domain-containing family protein [Actinoplanes octamycinicus]
MGPVQVLVVGFDHPAFSGEIIAEFTRLREAGIVRLVDLLLVARDEDGAVETLPVPPGTEAGLGHVTAALLGQPDGETGVTAALLGRPDGETGVTVPDDAAWSLADAVPPGSVAAVALIEHLWAGPLTTAIQKAGGVPLEETWLAPADLAALETLVSQRHPG